MVTLEEFVEQVAAGGARLYSESDGKLWKLNLSRDHGIVRINREPAEHFPAQGTVPGWEVLTAREREIVGLIMEGYTYRYISQHLFISEGTVKKTAHNAYGKLNISSRIDLLRTRRDS